MNIWVVGAVAVVVALFLIMVLGPYLKDPDDDEPPAAP